MTGVQLCPVDTWFFRDGSPFTMDAAAQEDVESLFPPHPPTVVGALRSALARNNGWDGTEPWSQKIRDALGDGPDDLGKVRVDGPFLLRCGQPLFRMPRHLLGVTEHGKWCPKALLRPGQPVECDLGEVRLPELGSATQDAEMLKPGDGEWITAAGLNAALRGELPCQDDVVPSRCLWSSESRIGLKRETEKRTASEGMLYSTVHVRLEAGVSLGARVSGLPESWAWPFGEMTPLGGESRLAELRPWDAAVGIESQSGAIQESGRAAIIALSPVDVEVGPNDEIPGLGVRVVSACMGRPQRIGGWDSLKRRPLPIRSTLPAGSVLFCKVSEPNLLAQAASTESGLARIGKRTEWGFGLAALGVWPD